MMPFDDIEDVLFDGSEEDMRGLSGDGRPISYAYRPSSGSFELAVGNERAKMHGVADEPNCVRIFGPEHTF